MGLAETRTFYGHAEAFDVGEQAEFSHADACPGRAEFV